MRRVLMCAVLICGCSGSALAQGGSPSLAWVPAGANAETAARPASEVGTGLTLPTADRVGDTLPRQDGLPLGNRLPVPPVDENASVQEFLLAARGALAAGRTGEAREALERAETRALDRSVSLYQTSTPIHDPLVAQIQSVLHALGAGDRMAAMQLLEQAIVGAAGR